MNSLRSLKSTYIAGFLLGGLISLLVAAPARSAELFRLERIDIIRFTTAANNDLVLQHGVLDASGEIEWRGAETITRPANTPTWALSRNLVNATAWLAFYSHRTLAPANFEIQEGGVRALIGNQIYFAVGARDGVSAAMGKTINGSTKRKLVSADM